MMNFESCEINNIVIHDIGNKYEDGKLRLSEACFLPDDMDVHIRSRMTDNTRLCLQRISVKSRT